MPRNVQTFDPNEVKAPQDLGPSNDLPEWIVSILHFKIMYIKKNIKYYLITNKITILLKSFRVETYTV